MVNKSGNAHKCHILQLRHLYSSAVNCSGLKRKKDRRNRNLITPVNLFSKGAQDYPLAPVPSRWCPRLRPSPWRWRPSPWPCPLSSVRGPWRRPCRSRASNCPSPVHSALGQAPFWSPLRGALSVAPAVSRPRLTIPITPQMKTFVLMPFPFLFVLRRFGNPYSHVRRVHLSLRRPNV